MCPKRCIDTIRSRSDLKFSKSYGDTPLKHGMRVLEPGSLTRTFGVPGISGYTGTRPRRDLTDPPSCFGEKSLGSAIPGYGGYVPSKTAESLFGRRFAVVTSACLAHVHDS